MKEADVWRMAAELAEMWASVSLAHANRLEDAWQQDVATQSARSLEALARAYRQLAVSETRELDFDDQPTPPVPMTAAGLLVLDDDPTDPGV